VVEIELRVLTCWQVRSSKQDQIHNSIVSTLLALMDGLDSRGQVVIIGATNRIDALDGALRRPGRWAPLLRSAKSAACKRLSSPGGMPYSSNYTRLRTGCQEENAPIFLGESRQSLDHLPPCMIGRRGAPLA